MSVTFGQIAIQLPGKPRDVLYTPLPHQARFHASTTKHCLMEGGAGSGKSLALRMDAYMRCLTIPRFRAWILRRQMPELRRSHLEYVPHEIARLGLPREAFHQTYNEIRFPNGSKLLFDHVEDSASLSRYLSSEAESIAFDELCTFELRQFKYLASRARTTIPGLMPIIRGGTNPVGIGASWVKRYFITKTVKPSEDKKYDPKNYESISSTIADNPYVNPDYKDSLASLPSEALVQAMLYGQWTIEGAMFPEWEPARGLRGWHVIGEMPRLNGRPIQFAPHIEIVRVVDWGYSAEGNPGMCKWYACLPDGSAICFLEYVFKETLPEDAAKEILRRSEGLRVRYTVGDTQMWAEHTGPSVAERFARAGLSMVEADKQREPGWIELHTWLRQTVDDGTGPRPRLSYLESGCPETIRTMPDMAVDPKNPADMVTTGVEDEGADTDRYFVMSRPGRSKEAPAPPASPERVAVEALIQKARRKRYRIGAEATHR